MAHVRQKLALQPPALLGFFLGGDQLGVERAQLGGADRDLLLQALPMARQRKVALLDLGQHVVEGVGKQPQLVIGLLGRAHGKIPVRRDLPRGLRQVQDWTGNGALQAGREQKRHQAGAQHQQRQSHAVAAKPRVHLLQIGPEIDRADRLGVQYDRREHYQSAVLEVVSRLPWIQRTGCRRSRSRVARKNLSGAIVNASLHQVAFRPKRAQGAFRRAAIFKCQRSGGVGCGHLRQCAYLGRHLFRQLYRLVEDECRAGQCQDNAAGKHDHEHQLPFDRHVPVGEHTSLSSYRPGSPPVEGVES